MAIVTYSNLDYGFGVTYDDALITRVDDPGDPRLRAAWVERIPTRIAVSILFTTATATVQTIAGGLVPSLLLTTDAFPRGPRYLALWDWEEAADAPARRFLEVTRAVAVEATGMYWRGFPVLQLTSIPPTDKVSAPVECLSLLHTPAQTFAIELVVPVGDLDEWSEPFQQIADGFFLLPIEREGRMRTGHQHVWSWRLDATPTKDTRAR